MKTDPESQGLSLWPWVFVCLAAAVWLDLGSIHELHCSDSLMPVLASVYRCTPYFWEQDRVGQLAAFLAWPCRGLFANLLAQSAIHLFTGLFAFILLGRYMLGRDTGALVGGISLLGCLACASLHFHWHLWLATTIGPWLALGLGGLLLAEGDASTRRWWRLSAAFLCLALAQLCYLSAAILLLPLVVVRTVFTAWHTSRQQPRWTYRAFLVQAFRLGAVPTGLVLLGTLCGYAGMLAARQLFQVAPTEIGAAPLATWAENAWRLASNAVQAFDPLYLWCFLVPCAVLGLVTLALRRARPQAAGCWRAAACLLVVALVFTLFFSTRLWVMRNDYCSRYLFGAMFVMQTALVIVGFGPIVQVLDARARRRWTWAAALGVFVVLLAGQGRPSVAVARRALDRLGPHTADLIEADCTHLVGDYWQVWPGVFHANMVLQERGDARTIWGVSIRSVPTAKYWQAIPATQLRVARLADDRVADWFLLHYRFPALELRQTRGKLHIFAAVEQAGTSATARAR